MSIPGDDSLYENPDFLIGDAGPINNNTQQFYCSKLAIEAWDNLKYKPLYCRRADLTIWPGWDKPKNRHLTDCLEEELKTYVAAIAELPSLVFRYFREEGVNTHINTSKQQQLCGALQPAYQTLSQWLEFLLFKNKEVPPELKTSPKKYLERTAKRYAALFQLIKQIWFRALAYQDKLCEWVLYYDSLPHLFFATTAHSCAADIDQKMLHGEDSARSKEQRYIDARGNQSILLNHPNQLLVTLEGERKNEIILPDTALCITELEVRKQGGGLVSASYQTYLHALVSEASYFRRTKQVRYIYMNKQGETFVGESAKQIKKRRVRNKSESRL